jgi:TRAP-type mannitol/chloroaromatic compound transport system permease small subunit
MYALLFFLGAFVIQMIMASVNSAHDDSAIERLQLVTGELPDYMKRNIMVATLLLIGLNVGLAVWIFS